MQINPIRVTGLDVLPLELCSQLPDLGIAERHYLVLTLSTVLGLLDLCPRDLDTSLEFS